MPIVAVSMTDKDLEELEYLQTAGEFSNRSEVVRHAVQSLMAEHRNVELAQGTVTAIVTAVYYKKGQGHNISVVQHEFKKFITATIHAHTSDGYCTEIMILTAKAEKVREFLKKLRFSEESNESRHQSSWRWEVMTEVTPLLEVHDLAVRYPNGELALHHVSFEIKSPSFMAIIGPNGSGKSTLVKTSLGLIKPSRGTIKVMGYDSQKKSGKIRKLVRYVPQRDRIDLAVPMKVKDIVLMGRLLKKLPPRFANSKDIAIAKDALQQVNMEELWERPFPELSGGQRQRVLVARALASEGSILVLDEPLAGTDVESQNLIVEALGRYHKENNVSIIMVTHDLNPIHTLVEDVLLLKNTVIGLGEPCSIMDPVLIKKVYGPTARIVEHSGHRYCMTHDSGLDRHD